MTECDMGGVEGPVMVECHVESDCSILCHATAVEYVTQLHQRDVAVLPAQGTDAQFSEIGKVNA